MNPPDTNSEPANNETATPQLIQNQQPSFTNNAPIAPQPPRKGAKILVAVLSLIAICFVGAILYSKHTEKPKPQPTKTISNGVSTSEELSDFVDPSTPIEVPKDRKTYSIHNGGYVYKFSFIKQSKIDENNDPKSEYVVTTPVKEFANAIEAIIQPATEQKAEECDSDDLHFTVKTVTIFGQEYPLCGDKHGNTQLSNSYTARFLYNGTWHELHVYHYNSGLFTEQLPIDILNSLKITKEV